MYNRNVWFNDKDICYRNIINMLYKRVLILVVCLTALCTCRGEPTLHCPARVASTHICVCVPGIIDCSGHDITAVPGFVAPSSPFVHLRLQHNNISRIDSSSFAALNVTDIDLSYNQISFIHDTAFSGISGKVEILNLAHNKLITLPNAMANLRHLKSLDVTWNPMNGSTYTGGQHKPTQGGLTDTTMRVLGSTIEVFKFGSPIMKTWPYSVSHLNRLSELRVAGVDLFYWPPDSFHGFEQTLKKLFIQNLTIGALPVGLHNLLYLEELHLDFLYEPFGDDSLISLPLDTLNKTLKVLSLTYDSLTYFPTAIKDLHALQSLTLDGNELFYVSDEGIKLLSNSNISRLSLKYCGLKRVPGALSDLVTLRELDLSNNVIRTLESTDLQNLASLRKLTLNNNPLQYMSDNSLCGLVNLEHFELVNTSLTEMSPSFKFLSHLRTMDLSQSMIDCTCKLTWVKYWMMMCLQVAEQPRITGACETIDMQIMDYVNRRIVDCPGYNLDIMDFDCEGCTGN